MLSSSRRMQVSRDDRMRNREKNRFERFGVGNTKTNTSPSLYHIICIARNRKDKDSSLEYLVAWVIGI